MLLDAFPGPASRDSLVADTHQPNGSMGQVQRSGQLPDLSPINLVETLEIHSDIDSIEPESEFLDHSLFELYEDSDLPERESNAREQSVAGQVEMADEQSSPALAGVSDQIFGSESAHTHNPLRSLDTHFPEPAATFTQPVHGTGFDDGLTAGQQSAEQATTPDPWENPLPSWDYSQNEWPVLMGPPREKKFGWSRPFLVALVLLSAAGFYFFILQPTLKEQRPSVRVAPREAEATAGDARANVPSPKPAEPAPAPVAAAPVSETHAAVDPKPTQAPEDGNTHGTFSLQAAAFPTQAGADEFAEKLRQAGVPSYIVSADLGKRGKWYRVRVGRFNTAEEAQKFASEAQHRAKAAGMSLQLIGCQYDQP